MASNKLLKIFSVTFKLGAFTFGGGYAMIPLMKNEFVDKHGWIEEKDITDVFAVAQSFPGVIAVNASLLIGGKIAGFWGGMVAAAGIVLPSFIVLSVVTLFYQAFMNNPYVIGALRGISAAVVALMLKAVIVLRKQSVFDIPTIILAAVCLGISFFLRGVSPVYIILGGGIIGLSLGFLPGQKKKAGKTMDKK